MATQPILGRPTAAAIILVLTVDPGREEAARGALADLPGVTRAVRFRSPDDDLRCIAGLGEAVWERLYELPKPRGLHRFIPLQGATHRAPSTPGDLIFHIRAARFDLCFELARQLTTLFAGFTQVVDEVHGFRYFDERDLLGFVDGTESPIDEEATEVVYIGDDDPAYAGGSYLIVQKYLHDLDAWNKLTVEQQELVIGRRKLDDIELPDDQKPSNSHVVLNSITDPDGTERQIVRENMPFGSVGDQEFGTYFIGYASDPGVTEEMLRNMFIGKPEGNHDQILDFSTAVTGSLFFIPTADFLEDPPTPEEASTPSPVPTPEIAADGSLGIGSPGRTTHLEGRP